MIEFENHDIIIELTPEGRDGASVTARGEWEADGHYYYLDIVSYNGGSYLAKTDVPAGTLPTNGTYWQTVASNAKWGEITGDLSDQEDLQAALNAKADADSVYTKTEADALLADKADKNSVYTKTEADALLAGKANASDVYTKTQVDDALYLKADKADSYTKDELDGIFDGIDNALDSKADADSVYSKSQTNNLLSAKANAADLGTMAGVNDAPSDGKEYARKNGQWAEVTGGIASVSWGDIDGTLSDQTDLKNALDAKANTADLGALADQDTVDYETEVTNKPTLGTMSAESASDYYDKTEVNDLINNSGVVAELDASGSIATFETNLAENLSRLSVAIDPVQDLNGYDNPWPAGGGKNLLDPDYREDIYSNVKYYASSENGLTLKAGDYTLSFSEPPASLTLYNKQTSTSIKVVYSTRIMNFTLTEETEVYIDSFYSTIPSGGLSSVQCQLESGSSATTWTPYSNVCPISGHSSATVTRTGKNLLKLSSGLVDNSQNISVTYTDDGIMATATANYARVMYHFKVVPNQTYTLHFDAVIITGAYNRIIVDNKNTWAWPQAYGYLDGQTSNTFTFTPTTEDVYLGMYITSNQSSGTYTASNVQLELGSTATAYESPHIQTVTIALGDTYYGAQLDAMAGTLTVTKVMVDLGDYDWYYSETVGHERMYCQSFDNEIKIPEASSVIADILCSSYKTASANNTYSHTYNSIIGIGTNGFVYIYDSNMGTDPSAFKTAMSGVQLVYPLATPTVITGLTPAQIQALIGMNNVWADTGDVAVSYFNNSTAEAITDVKQMIASTETSMTATRNYTSGSLIIVGPALLKATSNISSGASLVIGTNCVRTTLEEWILSLIA